MKEKEWKKEQKIPLLPVEFPEDSVMQKECRAIVEKAIPKRQSLWERIKEIYWGPGIRAIFYQSGSIWLIVACLYLGIGWLGQLYAKQPETQRMIVFLGFPVCFLVFAALAWWLDAQNHMQELIGSLHYSQSYLSGLRMLYAGVIMILVNVTGAALFTDVSGKAFVSMVLVGSSSVFLFASVCVYACHKGAGGLFYAGLIAVWACVCVIARLADAPPPQARALSKTSLPFSSEKFISIFSPAAPSTSETPFSFLAVSAETVISVPSKTACSRFLSCAECRSKSLTSKVP